ncbi:MAG: hypothetical protein DHS20C15_12060 [Planctomycetota bacterium]|nr:MAG: hypothetical protein DHS20C15_12060 [Planctomycetota bacterium]
MRPRSAPTLQPFCSLAGLFAALLLASPLQADTLRVPKDFATIQAAVDAAEGGDTILISSGTYTENVSVQEHAGGLILRGKGKVLLRAPNGDGYALRLGLSDGLRVEGLRFESSEYGLSVGQCNDVELSDLRFDDIDEDAIRILASTRVSVRDTRIDASDGGVYLQSSSVISLDGLVLKDVLDGVRLSTSCSVIHVANCRMQARPNSEGSGILAEESPLEIQLRGNRISGFSVGLVAQGNSVMVLDNVINNCDVGLRLGETNKTNLIQAVGNRVSKIAGVGIALNGNLMLLRDNRVSKANTGIVVSQSCFGNVLHDNRVTNSKTTALHLNGNTNAFAGNVFKNSGDDDIDGTGFGNQFRRHEAHPDGETLRVPKDFATISAAIAAADDGDTVLISSGTYNEALSVDDMTGLTLRGKGKVIVTQFGGTALNLNDSSDILVDNLRLEDSSLGLRLTDCAGVTVLDCHFEGNATGIGSTSGASLFVHDVRAVNQVSAVAVNSTARVVIDDSSIQGEGDGEGSSGVVASNATVLSMSGNRVWDHSSAVIGEDRNVGVGDNRVGTSSNGIAVSAEGGLVHANRVSKCGRGIETTNDHAGDAQVVGNRVIGCSDRGMLLGAAQAIIAENTVKKSGLHGLQHPSVQQVLVTGNRMLANGTDGLETQGAQHSLYVGNKAWKNKSLDLRVTDFDNNAFHANQVKATNLEEF